MKSLIVAMKNKTFKEKERDYSDFKFFFQINFISFIWWALEKKIKIIIWLNWGLGVCWEIMVSLKFVTRIIKK